MSADDMQGVASNTSDRAQDIARKTADRTKDASQKLSATAKQAVESAQTAMSRAGDAVGARSADVSEAMAATLDRGQRAYKQGRRQLRREVKKQPVEALLLAGAIGYLVGWATNQI